MTLNLADSFNPNPKPSFGRKPPNPDCYYIGKRLFTKIKCDDCGFEIQRRTDSINSRGTGSFCKLCVAKKSAVRMKSEKPHLKTGETLKCKNCEKEFYGVRSKLETRKYCSKDCKYKYQSEHQDKTNFIKNTVSGEQHSNYKHGKRVGKHENKPKLRLSVVERDGGKWCLLCGKPGPGLHLHRINYGSEGGKYELGNCVLLCGDDHALVHTSKITWKPLLLDYLESLNPEIIRKFWMDREPAGIQFKRKLKEGA